MINDHFYQPVNGDFSGKLPMKSIEKLTYLRSIEDLYRYKGDKALGTYYPVRTLPSMYIDDDAEWPMVMPAGSIVSIISLKDAAAYTVDDAIAGIKQTGLQYVSIGVDGVALQKSINHMYDKEVSGLFELCNGGVTTNRPYSNDDGKYGIIGFDGVAASAATTAYSSVANRPAGIVNNQVAADMRYRYLNYDARQGSAGMAIQKDGVLTIPYVDIIGGTGPEQAAIQTAIRGAVNAKHQYALFTGATRAAVDAITFSYGTVLQSDEYGKFKIWGGSDVTQKFGRILEARNRIPYNIDEIIDSFPGSGMKGMDTGGMEARFYNFVKSILSLTAIQSPAYAAVKTNLKNAMITPVATQTAGVSVLFGQIDVEFGIY